MDVLFWREQLPSLRFIAHAYHRHTIVSDRVVNIVYVCLCVCACTKAYRRGERAVAKGDASPLPSFNRENTAPFTSSFMAELNFSRNRHAHGHSHTALLIFPQGTRYNVMMMS